ncbi:MAG: VgrG-related protein [Aggregatilineales bacterium]
MNSPATSDVLIDQIRVSVDGQALTTDQLSQISTVTVESCLHIPDMAELRFESVETDMIDGDDYKVGKSLSISMSNEQKQLTSIFNGEIVGVEPDFSESVIKLVVRGYDKAHRLHRGTKTKVFKNVTDSDIANQIAQDAGLSATVDATTETFEEVIQYAQTDFDFLVMRAQRIGYEVLTENGQLKFVKPTSPSSADATLEFRHELMAFHPRLGISAQVDTVTAKGWDVKQKQGITGTASSSDVQAQIGNGQSGGAEAQSALSGGASNFIVNIPVQTQSDATRVAQGLLDQINSRFIQADGEAVGTPSLHAGMVVEIKGIGTKFGGKYRLTTVRHQYNAGDYRILFSVEGPRPDLITYLVGGDDKERWGGVYPALVTNNKNDTNDFAYVKLKYPWLDDTVESNWARVALPGGGAQRGIYFMPEVNDEVLVAFEFGDFDRPYVIGGLYNGSDAPAAGLTDVVANGKVKTRMIKTRTGHTITFVDDDSGQEYIDIKDAKGNTELKFDTANKKITMTSQGEIEINATGNLTLTSQQDISIKTDSGNVTIQGMTFSAKGTNSAEMKSDSGAANVQGLTFSVKGQASGSVEAVEVGLKGDAMVQIQGGLVQIN